MNLIQKNDREQALEYIFTPEFQTKLQDVLDLKAQVAKMKDDYQNLQKSNTHLSNKLEEYQTELDEIKKSFLSEKGGSEDNWVEIIVENDYAKSSADMKSRECVRDMRVNVESVSLDRQQNKSCCVLVALNGLRLQPVWTSLMRGGKIQKISYMEVKDNENISAV